MSMSVLWIIRGSIIASLFILVGIGGFLLRNRAKYPRMVESRVINIAVVLWYNVGCYLTTASSPRFKCVWSTCPFSQWHNSSGISHRWWNRHSRRFVVDVAHYAPEKSRRHSEYGSQDCLPVGHTQRFATPFMLASFAFPSHSH